MSIFKGAPSNFSNIKKHLLLHDQINGLSKNPCGFIKLIFCGPKLASPWKQTRDVPAPKRVRPVLEEISYSQQRKLCLFIFFVFLHK